MFFLILVFYISFSIIFGILQGLFQVFWYSKLYFSLEVLEMIKESRLLKSIHAVTAGRENV